MLLHTDTHMLPRTTGKWETHILDCSWLTVHLTESIFFAGDSGEAEGTLVEGSHRAQGTDSDLMDGETEGDTAVIAGQPEVLSTTAMQVENELVDLIDELLERDTGAVNSSIIGKQGVWNPGDC